MPRGLLAVAYFMTLSYLFLGISIVAEVFMAGIEQITSQTVKVDIKDDQGHVIRTAKVLVWNPTVANLSLMALGSSAPEILLAVVETVGSLGKCPGELGASTIVGSAAFNLLVISGLSIYAVSEGNDDDPRRDFEAGPPKGVKKIYDMGVFSITSFFSIWAYVWLFLVLRDQNVEIWEAWVTFGSFIFLVIICYLADRYKAAQEEKKRLASGEGNAEIFQYSAAEIYRTLIAEK
jgi:solute carrier family 8 (sodium/calcium exchanger)